MSFSLQTLVKDHLRHYFSKLPQDSHYVLIVDPTTLSSLSSSLELSDLLEYNVALIEKLFLKRQPFPQMDVVYLISASETSVEKMLEDWDLKGRKMYKDAYIFFSGRASDSVMTKLKSSRIVSHVKQLIELNIEFLPLESQMFTYRDESDMLMLYSSEIRATDRTAYINKCAEKLATVFATLNDIPHFRFRAKSPLAEEVANAAYKKTMALARSARVSQSDKTVCLILDRGSDPIAPLVHEFTYQAMVYDLLNIGPDQIYTYTSKLSDGKDGDDTRQVILNEQDPLWVKYRHKLIIPDVRNGVDADHKKFKEKNFDLQEVTKDKSSAKNRIKVMHRIPEYQKMVNTFELHIRMISDSMKIFDQCQLQNVGVQEQNMAVNQSEDGEDLSNIIAKLGPIFKADVTEDIKIRLILLYLITQGSKNESSLWRIANLDDEEDEVRRIAANMEKLGYRTGKESLFSSVKNTFLKLGKKKKDFSDMLTLCRFQPNLKDTLTELIQNKLSTTHFPYLHEPDTAIKFETSSGKGKSSTTATAVEDSESSTSRSKRKRPTWVTSHLKKQGEGSEKEEQSGSSNTTNLVKSEYKVVVFMVGGATYSECRSVYEVTEETGVPCYLGCTSLLTPKSFIEKLEELGSDDLD